MVPNISTPGGAAVTFAAARTVANSNFAGTPVGGNQGVATGDLSTTATTPASRHRRIIRGSHGTDESMVAVFQNLDDLFSYSRGLTTAGADFDAGQTNPTAIALLFLTNSVTPTPRTVGRHRRHQ